MKHFRQIALGCLLFASTCAAAEPPARPNIVILLADDLGYGDLHCFGDPVVRTPNIDRLAAQGLRLTSCYAAGANCSPARTGLMTGRIPTRAGVTDWIPQFSPMHLRRGETTIATLLRNAGYATCLTGKWHLNGGFEQATQPQPGDHGFEYWFATQNIALPNHHNPINFYRNGEAVGPQEGYSAQIIGAEASRWLREKRDKSKPFFLYVAFHEPHEPIATDTRFSGLYADAPPAHADFSGNITQFDEAVGTILRTLDEQGATANTFLYLTSDNGPAITPMHPFGSAGPLRGKKNHLYEGGIRVPGIIHWPEHVQAGASSDEPVSGLDLFPTLCALAGLTPPANRPLDGTSILPALEGRALTRPHPLFWHLFSASSAPKVAMRDGDWKLLGFLDAPEPKHRNDIDPGDQQALKTAGLTKFELYNLRDDIGEKHDLASREPERLKTLSTEMTRLYREVRDECPEWPAWKFANYDGPRIVWPPYWKPGQRDHD